MKTWQSRTYGTSKSVHNREVYSNKNLPQEARIVWNMQADLMSKWVGKGKTKPKARRRRKIKIRVDVNDRERKKKSQ